MPPLAALKMLLALGTATSWCNTDGERFTNTEPYMISFVDVKRAHFMSPATRELYVELPTELGYERGYVGKLRQS
eukprot:12584140-Prorocentrum_lima.AAC.1